MLLGCNAYILIRVIYAKQMGVDRRKTNLYDIRNLLLRRRKTDGNNPSRLFFIRSKKGENVVRLVYEKLLLS